MAEAGDNMSRFFARLVEGADDVLKAEHAWLLENMDLIKGLIDAGNKSWAVTADGTVIYDERKYHTKQMAAQEIYNHFLKWANEVAWFTQPDAGKITFKAICDHINQDPARALENRLEFFRLPVSVKKLYQRLRYIGARDKCRNQIDP